MGTAFAHFFNVEKAEKFLKNANHPPDWRVIRVFQANA
jgi:hypothetical protein